tara:strand:+ start:199 stop:717 length:519 start_codon:yes stop_codon:yes gene_type:complete
MDLKNVLNEEVHETQKNTENVRVHKKPIQLRDIENRSANNHEKLKHKITEDTIKEMLKKEKESIYFKPWNKLDNGLKLNLLKKYIDKETIDKNLDENKKKKLSKLLLTNFENNKMNKLSDIKYDIINGEINEIKNLIYCPETSKYSFKVKETKPKTTTKSKTNIERLLSKKK